MAYLEVDDQFWEDPVLAPVSGAALLVVLRLASVAVREHGGDGSVGPEWVERVQLARYCRLRSPEAADVALGELLKATAVTRTSTGGVLLHPRLWGQLAGELLRWRSNKREARIAAKMADARKRFAHGDGIADREALGAVRVDANKVSRKSRDIADPIASAARRMLAVTSAARKVSDVQRPIPGTSALVDTPVSSPGSPGTSRRDTIEAARVGSIMHAAGMSPMSRDVPDVPASVKLISPDSSPVSAASPGLSLQAREGGASAVPPAAAAPPVQPAPIPRGKGPTRPPAPLGHDAWNST